ncbi:Holliday junction resolvase [Candidatus Woesearchaeota archaeon]|jgi:Holliday junction resolvase|nr:Holliday junction resolvase [Candidatus Woesearchaeota archaeon]
MSLKSKGINAERELIHKFWGSGWASTRVAGSGSIKYASPDVIAGRGNRKIVIECKVTKNTRQYLTHKEVKELQEFASIFGGEAWIGVKFNSYGWYFLNIEDLELTPKSYVTSLEHAKLKGLLFEELIEFK